MRLTQQGELERLGAHQSGAAENTWSAPSLLPAVQHGGATKKKLLSAATTRSHVGQTSPTAAPATARPARWATIALCRRRRMTRAITLYSWIGLHRPSPRTSLRRGCYECRTISRSPPAMKCLPFPRMSTQTDGGVVLHVAQKIGDRCQPADIHRVGLFGPG
jgi:hypothetical protein